MGPWRSFKRWLKRTVVNIVLRIARTRFMRYVRKLVRASAAPVAIVTAGSLIGVGVASAVAFPLGYGALIGGGASVLGLVVTKFYLKNAAESRSRQRLKLNYTVWSRKGNSPKGRAYVVEASSSSRRF